MKAAIINKINKIKSRRLHREEDIRPSLYITPREPRPREKDEQKQAPSKNVIIIDLM